MSRTATTLVKKDFVEVGFTNSIIDGNNSPIKIYYEIHGSGANKILFIMGLNTTLGAWENQIGWTSDVNLVGISMGGMISQELVLLKPHYFKSLCLTSTTSGLTIPPISCIITLMKLFMKKNPIDKVQLAVDALFPEHWLKSPSIGSSHNTNRERVVESMVQRISNTRIQPVRGAIGQISACLRHYVSSERLRIIQDKIPKILVVTGNLDNFVRPSNSFYLAEELNADFEYFEGSGHVIPGEQPERYNSLLEEHFRKAGLIDSLIIKYIAETGKEPVTDEDLSVEDLLEVKTSTKIVKPRPQTFSSIPSLLTAFQNEWDSLMLESFTLKRKYQEAQQELSHALFQYDAARRVIARTIKERDVARDALANIKSHIEIQPPADTSTSEAQKMQVDEEKGIGSSIIEKLVEASVVLSKGRKKRKPPPSLTPADTIKTFTQISTIPALHNSSTPGILCMDLDQTEKLVLTGGVDKKALIYNLEEGKVVSQLKGHTKKITNVLWREKAEAGESDIVFTASADKSVRIWNNTKKGYKTSSTISIHNAEVTSIALNPTKDYLVSVSEDSTWGFHDIATAQTLVKIENSDVKDGTGTNDSVVRIWDIKAQQNVATMEGHTGKVKSLSFSENGYYLATSSEDNLIKIWDLRKQTNVHTLTLENTKKINKVVWDYSGQYIAVCGSDIRIFQSKTWNELIHITENIGEITDMKFGSLAKFLITSGLDRSLRIFGTTEAETITEPEVQE
nr:3203_t:CDS:10 [Entrophospora candida]